MRLSRHFRTALHLQWLLLQAVEAEVLVGGQAVMEGVMMRAPHSYAVAVRRPDGTLATTTRRLVRPSERNRMWALPLLRGLAVLGQAMTLGVRALRFASAHALQDDSTAANPPAGAEEVSGASMTLALAGSLLFFVAFYKFVPLLAATELQKHYPAVANQILFNLVDGGLRIFLFLVFIAGLGLMPDIRRVYQYHGAEHKVVYNHESGQPVDVEHARRFSTLHPRCGTSFMLVIMLIAMAIYMLIPVHGFVARLLIRIALLPLIAGVSYEIIRYSARHSRSVFALLARPGLWLQRITTQEPGDDQLECSIRSLDEAMTLEKSQGGEAVLS